MKTELLPCPFCGSPAVVKSNKTVMVNCTQCTASTFQRLGDKDSAIVNWNNRSEPLDRLLGRVTA